VTRRRANDETRHTVLVVPHLHADLDAFASALGAALLFEGAVVTLPGGTDRSVTHLLQAGIEPGIVMLGEKQALTLLEDGGVERIVLVDTASPERTGPFAPYAEALPLTVFDHHPSEAPPADDPRIEWHRQTTGANTTQIVQLLLARNCPLTPDQALILAAGIMEDTGWLAYPVVTPADLHALADLVACGARLDRLAQLLDRPLTEDQVHLLGDLLNTLEEAVIEGVTVAWSTAACERYIEDLSIVTQRLMRIHPVDALVVGVQMERRMILVGRSAVPDRVDIGHLFIPYGGGGHPQAGSANLKGETLAGVRAWLPGALAQAVLPGRRAAQVMSRPVQTAAPDERLNEVTRRIHTLGVGGLPVVEGGKVVGWVARETADRGVHHALGDEPVSRVMAGEVPLFGADSGLDPIVRAIMVDGRRWAGIVDDSGDLIGCITRTDLRPVLAERMGGEVGSGAEIVKRRNLWRRLSKALPDPALARLTAIGDQAQAMGMEAYLVGGGVRDLLLNRPGLDLDIVVVGEAVRLAEQFGFEHPEIHAATHPPFGTATLVYPDGQHIDIVTARAEHYPHPAALPVVDRGPLGLDLARRDFTVNALAIALDPKRRGELVDPYGGLRDLEDRKIRVLHPLSFVEDPTRIYRAVRFEATLDFRIGPQTLRLLRDAVKQGYLQRLTGKRIGRELDLILRSIRPAAAIARMGELGVLACLHDQLDGAAIAARLEAFEPVDRAATLLAPDLNSDAATARWELLLLDLQAAQWGGLLERIEWSGRRLKELRRDLGHLQAMAWGAPPNPEDAWAVVLACRDLSPEALRVVMAQGGAVWEQAVAAWLTRLRHLKPQSTGEDWKRWGARPGPGFKTLHDALWRGVVEGTIDGVEGEERVVRGGV